MEPTGQVSRVLHDEHMAVISLLERLNSFIAARRKAGPPAAGDGETMLLLGDLSAALDVEVVAHFGFEEDRLFPVLVEAGYGDICEMLSEEHVSILSLAERVSTLAKDARKGGFDGESWAEFCRMGAALAGDLTAHAEKEEMSLLEMLEDALDADTDARLAGEYAATR